MSDVQKCDACGINQWNVMVEYSEGWHVCFLCIAEFVAETDATPEAFDWWIEKERGNDGTEKRILADDLEALPWWQHAISVLALCVLVLLSAVVAVFDGARDE